MIVRAGARAIVGCMIGIVLLLGLIQCDGSDLVAPDGSTITLVANPLVLLPSSDSASVSIVTRESAGDAVVDGTRIVVTASSGSLCIPLSDAMYSGRRCTDTTAPVSAVFVATQAGLASLRYKSAAAPGPVTLTATSGKATGTIALTVSNQLAPAGASLKFGAVPDTVKGGDASLVTVFVASGTTPVADGTRVVFSATSGTISPALVLTVNGFASTQLRAPAAAGIIFVRGQSGSLIDSVRVVVTP